MLSESVRMSSAAEARYRVQAPNSKPRTIKVIALDPPSEAVVRRLADEPWTHTTFFTALSRAPGAEPAIDDGPLRDLTGRSRNLFGEVSTADLVVMVATPGGHAAEATSIGEACSLSRVMTTALVAHAMASSEEALAQTLAQLRPWSLMTVIADADDYIDDMLAALRA